MPRPMLRAVSIVLLISLALTSTALAGFSAPQILRTAASGVDLFVADLAARGSNVVVGWEEDHPGGRASFMRWSTNGGVSFQPRVRLDTRPNREIQVDVCGGEAWAVSALHVPENPPSEWVIVLDGRSMTGGGYEAGLLTYGGVARKPDIACVGHRRLATAWFKKVGGIFRVKFFSRAVHLDFEGTISPEVSLDLGTGSVNGDLAMAATNDRIIVAWFDGDLLKVKRFNVGGGFNAPITPLATNTLATLPSGFGPELAIAGDRAVLAYTNKADLVARVSTNGGDSWGPIRTLLDVPFPSEVAAYASNADVQGTKIIVAGQVVGLSDPGLAGEGFVDRTGNNGSSWAFVPGTTRDDGNSVAGYTVAGGAAKVVQAWDEWISDPAVDDLRFHRQT